MLMPWVQLTSGVGRPHPVLEKATVVGVGVETDTRMEQESSALSPTDSP
jgi:hypothetical protein